MGSNILIFPTGTFRAGQKSARGVFHPPRAPSGPGVVPAAPGHSFLRHLAHAVPFSTPRAVRAWRASIAAWWSRFLHEHLRIALAELLTTAAAILLIAPWLTGIFVIGRWIWAHLP